MFNRYKKSLMEKRNDYTGGKCFLAWLVKETPVAFVFLTLMLLLGIWFWFSDTDKAPFIVVCLFYAGYLGAAWNNWRDLKKGIRN